MNTAVRQPAWVLILQGIIAILFGLVALFYPHFTVAILITLFGAFVLVHGVVAIIFPFVHRSCCSSHRWLSVIDGVLSIVIGVWIFSWPKMSSLILVYFIAAWAVLMGIVQLVTYIKLQRDTVLLLSAVLSIIIGIVFFRFPMGGIMTITWLVGLYALIFGLLSLVAVGYKR